MSATIIPKTPETPRVEPNEILPMPDEQVREIARSFDPTPDGDR